MKLAIMQPYVFPYLGYFQLINAVDKFVIYDDVTYIKQGWINRNRILVGGKEHMFTIHLKKSSSNTLINNTEINSTLYNNWKSKFYKTIENSYKNAPYYNEAVKLVKEILDTSFQFISDIARESIKAICNYLGIDTEIVNSSSVYKNSNFSAQERVIDICKKEKASEYINVSGGVDLYSKEDFKKEGLQLNFIKTNFTVYKQSNKGFTAGLSIIDILMFNSIDEIRQMLKDYTLQ